MKDNKHFNRHNTGENFNRGKSVNNRPTLPEEAKKCLASAGLIKDLLKVGVIFNAGAIIWLHVLGKKVDKIIKNQNK